MGNKTELDDAGSCPPLVCNGVDGCEFLFNFFNFDDFTVNALNNIDPLFYKPYFTGLP